MNIYECELTLLENTFFSSREIHDFYQTEPLIGNYALAYALGYVNSPYFNDGKIYYYEHLTELKNKGIYITPAKFFAKVTFRMTRFNGISDSYWFSMAPNALLIKLEQKYEPLNNKPSTENFPHIGFIKMLGIGNEAKFYIFSKNEIMEKKYTKYIRLGKFMSKAKVGVKKVDFKVLEKTTATVNHLLNPVDIPKDFTLKSFDAYSVNPVTLIDNVTLSGNFYQINDVKLPMGMEFNVEMLKGV